MTQEVISTRFADLCVPCMHDGKTIQVSLGPLCDAMHLDRHGEIARLGRNPELTPVLSMPPGDARGLGHATLPIAALVFWFGQLRERHDSSDLRRRLAVLQDEGFSTALSMWLARLEPTMTEADIRRVMRNFARLQRQIETLADALKNDVTPIERDILRAQLTALCQFPIGPQTKPVNELDRFWKTLFAYMESGKDINHARRSHRFLALNFRHLEGVLAQGGDAIQVTPELRLALKQSRHPHFLGLRVVNSRIARKSLRCWVFNLA
jgi:hypothetical protein